RKEFGQDLGTATSLRGLGKALSKTGQLQGARDALIESSALFLREEALPGYASSRLALAHVEAGLGRRGTAIDYAREARGLLAKMPPAERKLIGPTGTMSVRDADILIHDCM